MKAFFRKGLDSLAPLDEDAQALLAKIKYREVVEIDIKRGRNARHSAKYWVMIGKVWANQDAYEMKHDVSDAFLIATNRFRWGNCIVDGQTYRRPIPDSISFAKMDQDEFSKFYDEAMNFLCEKVIPGLDKADLQNELLEMAA